MSRVSVHRWLNVKNRRRVHGHRRGFAPLHKRLSAIQLLVRAERIALRAETKALAKLVQRRAARKGIKT